MSFRTCNHLKEDVVPCGSPALRGKKLCYYHQRDHKRRHYAAGVLRRADTVFVGVIRTSPKPSGRCFENCTINGAETPIGCERYLNPILPARAAHGKLLE